MVDDYLTRHYRINVPQVFAVEKKLRFRHRIVWTHMGGDFRRPYFGIMNFDTLLLRNLPYVFLARNFYAILNSAYHHRVYRRRVVEATPSEFIRDPYCGILHLVSYYNMWLHLRRQLPRFVSFSYEELKRDTPGTLRNVIEAFGIEPDDQLIAASANEGSAGNMKMLAESPAYSETVLAPTDPNEPRSAKVRETRASSYAGLFSPDDLDYIANVIDEFFLGKDDPEFGPSARRID